MNKTKYNPAPLNAAQVRRLEWKSILGTRRRNQRPTPPEDCSEWDRGLIGLALSGGGIRGATFHLGLLQAFAKHHILACFDYISAVSGGGFIAGWLCKLIHTRALKNPSADPLQTISRRLDARTGRESPEVHWLRQHLTYLTPQGGLFAQSSWLFGATYLHNLAINFSILSLAVAAVFIAPRVVIATLYHTATTQQRYFNAPTAGTLASMFIFGDLLLVITWLIRHRRRAIKAEQKLLHLVLSAIASVVVLWYFYHDVAKSPLVPYPQRSLLLWLAYAIVVRIVWRLAGTSNRAKMRFLALTSLCGAFLAFAWFFAIAQRFTFTVPRAPYYYCQRFWEWSVSSITRLLEQFSPVDQSVHALAEGAVAGIFIAVLAGCCYLLSTQHLSKLWRLENKWWFEIAKFGIATTCVIYLNSAGIQLLCAVVDSLKSVWPPPAHFFVGTMVFLVPLLAAGVAFVFNILTALLGRIISHFIRLEVAALSTVLYRYAFAWLCVAAIALYGPLLLYATGRRTHIEFWMVWLLAGLIGFAVRKEPKTQRDAARHIANALLGLVPYSFFVCYMLFITFAISAYGYGIVWRGSAEYWVAVLQTLHPGSLALLSSAALLVFILSARFGVNSPSMHMFYQSRIADAYLREVLPGGEASSDFKTVATAESGLSSHGLGLQELCREQTVAFNGPYLLLSAALNLVSSDEPAWQDRRAANFLFSPLFCGYEPARLLRKLRRLPKNAYRATSEYCYGTEKGIRLAQAMSISGSAIGSSMGYHTSPRVRFLHTVLNLRLGWWFSNPRFPRSWEGLTPRSRIGLLLSELAGRTHDHGPVVHLSDGGHFENLGLYELVRRRCRVIIVSDASEDRFGNNRALGNAIERCRTDFGIDIDLDVSKLRVQNGYGKEGLAVGRILYGPTRVGVLIYIKPVLTGNEPIDVLSYARLHTRFPNESTANQWFKESQFESYRRLGLFVGIRAAGLLERHGGADGIVRSPEGILAFAETESDVDKSVAEGQPAAARR